LYGNVKGVLSLDLAGSENVVEKWRRCSQICLRSNDRMLLWLFCERQVKMRCRVAAGVLNQHERKAMKIHET
jgi:hypothetical protein